MSGYIVVYRESPVHDDENMAEYSRLNREKAEFYKERFGIIPLAVYGQCEALEGESPSAVIVLKFPSISQARAWYESPEYQKACEFRKLAADWRVVIVEGLPG